MGEVSRLQTCKMNASRSMTGTGDDVEGALEETGLGRDHYCNYA